MKGEKEERPLLLRDETWRRLGLEGKLGREKNEKGAARSLRLMHAVDWDKRENTEERRKEADHPLAQVDDTKGRVRTRKEEGGTTL